MLGRALGVGKHYGPENQCHYGAGEVEGPQGSLYEFVHRRPHFLERGHLLYANGKAAGVMPVTACAIGRKAFLLAFLAFFPFSPALAFFVSLLVQRWVRGLQTQHAFRHHVALNLI